MKERKVSHFRRTFFYSSLAIRLYFLSFFSALYYSVFVNSVACFCEQIVSIFHFKDGILDVAKNSFEQNFKVFLFADTTICVIVTTASFHPLLCMLQTNSRHNEILNCDTQKSYILFPWKISFLFSQHNIITLGYIYACICPYIVHFKLKKNKKKHRKLRYEKERKWKRKYGVKSGLKMSTTKRR